MTLNHAITQFIATNNLSAPQLELLERVLRGLNSPKRDPIKIKPEMPPFDRKRREFTQLMPAHLLFVEEIGLWEYYNRSETHDWMLTNYDKLFPRLRRKGDERPSDELKKTVMISRLLDLVDSRRAEISDRERASVRHVNPAYEYQGLSR